MCGVGEGPKISTLGEVAFPHSLGMYYTALTQYLGFWKFGDEYKVMGLAAYGAARVISTNFGASFGPIRRFAFAWDLNILRIRIRARR